VGEAATEMAGGMQRDADIDKIGGENEVV